MISVSALAQKGASVKFHGNYAIIRHGTTELVKIERRNGMYEIPLVIILPESAGHRVELAYSATNHLPLSTWHRRLGHVNRESIIRLLNAKKIPFTDDDSNSPCLSCIKGKSITKSVTSGSHLPSTRELFGRLHMDLIGPLPVSTEGFTYSFIIIDDASRYTWFIPLRSKSETFTAYLRFESMVRNQYKCDIRTLRSDNGGEFILQEWLDHSRRRGITREWTAPNSPHQNGVVERFNGTLSRGIRSILAESNLPDKFWADAGTYFVYVSNHTSKSSLKPYEDKGSLTSTANLPTSSKLIHSERPGESMTMLEDLRVFGCDAYALNHDHIPKFDDRTTQKIFVGFSLDDCGRRNQDGYRLYDARTKRYCSSRSVSFLETSFTHGTGPSETLTTSQNTIAPAHWISNTIASGQINISPMTKPVTVAGSSTNQTVNELSSSTDSTVHIDTTNPPSSQKETANYDKESDDNLPEAFVLIDNVESDDDSNQISDPVMPVLGTTRSGRQYRGLTGAETGLNLFSNCDSEPTSYNAAITGSDKVHWQAAIASELESLVENKVFEEVPLPAGKRCISSKWIFKVKINTKGEVTRHKARFVARGFSQREGIDYTEIFAPVAKFTTIRTLLSVAAIKDFELHSMDACTAFLNGDIEEEVYINPPEGHETIKPNVVWRLRKTLYGLKQSPRGWNQRLDRELKQLGWTRCESDHALYNKLSSNQIDMNLMCVYVDDFLIAAIKNDIQDIKEQLKNCFKMTDNKEANEILGIAIRRDRSKRQIYLSQTAYAESILKTFDMVDCKPVATPLVTDSHFTKSQSPSTPEEERIMKNVPYREAVGKVMYLMLGTRPDLAYSVSVLSRFVSNPGEEHWKGLKRVLRYVKGTLSMNLTLGGKTTSSEPIHLHGYCDADWGGDIDTRCSTTGWVFIIGNGVVSWSSKRQATPAHSSTEAEYVALGSACREALWLRQLCIDCGENQALPTTIYEDNQGAIALVKNPVQHQRTKHIDIQYHIIRSAYEQKQIDIQWVRTESMIADVLTKGLSREAHTKCVTGFSLTT